MEKTTRFSQNFLRDPHLVKTLLSKTNIRQGDTVYDIGGGKGIIAAALSEICLAVVSVEIDPRLVNKLYKNLQNRPNVLIYEADFLDMALPRSPYKVFANIPFNLSNDIVRKLTTAKHPPRTSYLIVQKEFADKLISKPNHYNSLLSVLLGVRFDVSIVESLRPTDFYPRPSVATVLVEISIRSENLVADKHQALFRDFVMYAYNAFLPSIATSFSGLFTNREFSRIAKELEFAIDAKPSQLHLEQWLSLFSYAMQKRTNLEALVKGYESIVEQRHPNRTKLHRTRHSHI